MPNSPHLDTYEADAKPASATPIIPRKPLPLDPSVNGVSHIRRNDLKNREAPGFPEKEREKIEGGTENVEHDSMQTDFDVTGCGHPQQRRKIISLGGRSIFTSRDNVADTDAQRYGQRDARRQTYLGSSRKRCTIAVAGVVTVVVVLIVGLAVGLQKHAHTNNLPLPQNKGLQIGELTYYMPGLGACGITNRDSDSIVAVSRLLFDAAQKGSDPNQNPLCGKKIRTTRFNEKANSNRSADLTVTDRCVGCKATDLDVTMSVFDKLADRDLGRVLTTWAWLG